jgi:hypothetical protein
MQYATNSLLQDTLDAVNRQAHSTQFNVLTDSTGSSLLVVETEVPLLSHGMQSQQ